MRPNLQMRHGPDAFQRTEAANHTLRSAHSNARQGYSSNRPIDALLARLDHARQHGRGYRADCPVGHSSRGALSIAEGDDGRVLLTCFAGCAAADVLAKLDMGIADLFPERVVDHSPLGRAQRREIARASDWAAALGVLARESSIVLVAAGAIRRSGALAANDDNRLALAVERIQRAREVLA